MANLLEKIEKVETLNDIPTEELGYHNEYKIIKETDKKIIIRHVHYYEIDLEGINYEQFITEDDTPVDNLFSEKQQRLLIDPLHIEQWTDRNFLAATNGGESYAIV